MNETEFWEFLEVLRNNPAVEPLKEALRNVIILIISNLAFYKAARLTYEASEADLAFLPGFAAIFGLVNILLCGSWKMAQYVLIMTLVFGAVYESSLLLRRYLGYTNLYHFTKAISVILAAFSFRFLHDEDHFPTYLSIYITMCFKLMGAAEDAQYRTFEELHIFKDKRVPSCFEVMGYLVYTGYTPYKDFLSLCNKQHEKSERWRNMILSSAFRAIIFKIISYKLLEYETLGDIYLQKYVLFVIRAFQFRCQYYYWLQLREMEAVAAGIKRGGWVKHTAFNFKSAELSVRVVDFLIAFNLPISSSLRNRFSTETPEDVQHIGTHTLVALVVVLSYNPTYAFFLGLFISGIYAQNAALNQLTISTCLVACKGVDCRHTWTRRYKSFHLIRFFLITLNQMRLSLLVCSLPGWTWNWAMAYGTMAILMDGIILSIIMCTGVNKPPPPRRLAKRRVFH